MLDDEIVGCRRQTIPPSLLQRADQVIE